MPNNHDKMHKMKREAAEIYGSICEICHKKYGRGFLFHHLNYVFGEYTYRDFEDTVKYNLYVIPIVLKNPKRFILLCKKCHTTVTRLKQREKNNLLRLLLVVWMTA
ncbi:MAG: hypothetical protein ACRD9Q_06685 [Nitrososphaeraceae archaeon]